MSSLEVEYLFNFKDQENIIEDVKCLNYLFKFTRYYGKLEL